MCVCWVASYTHDYDVLASYQFIQFFTVFFSVGQPRLKVDLADVELFRSLRFSWSKIAQLLGVSRSTLYRRLEEEGISLSMIYTVIDDQHLDQLVYRIKLNHPYDGERLLAGHLISRGVYVTRARLRASIHRVDPVNTALRRSIVVRRRVYFANGPNHVWHIDGNHKLIRWKLVVHGGIDGYSRTIVFLSCANNNRAATVFSAFEGAVALYGIPSRVRTDLGGENVDVWSYMIDEHQSESAVITGSSTHNERIERLWRDVFRSVGSVFYEIFSILEANGQLDPLNDSDIFCLHWVYLPKLRNCIQQFMQSWNNHPVSSERNQTPNQLFVQGILNQQHQHPLTQITGPTNASALIPQSHVDVPSSHFQPCDTIKQSLEQAVIVSPTLEFNDGTAQYLQVVDIVGTHLQTGCNICL